MPAVGLLIALIGGFLLSSSMQNKAPLATLMAIITNPSQASTALREKGEAYASASPDAGASPGGTTVTSSGTAGTGTGGALRVTDGVGSGIAAPKSSVTSAIAYARAQIGKPYKWGKTGPSEFDCSGLVMKAYAAGGITLPRTTAQMVLRGKAVKRADLIPGDLVFPTVGHVGIYTGGGKMVDAPRAGSSVSERNVWGFWTARRVV